MSVIVTKTLAELLAEWNAHQSRRGDEQSVQFLRARTIDGTTFVVVSSSFKAVSRESYEDALDQLCDTVRRKKTRRSSSSSRRTESKNPASSVSPKQSNDEGEVQ